MANRFVIKMMHDHPQNKVHLQIRRLLCYNTHREKGELKQKKRKHASICLMELLWIVYNYP